MEILNLGGSQEPSARPSKKKFKVVLGIGLLAGVMGMGSTLAATVSINTGRTVEFGQGVASTTACDPSLTVTPGTTYVNDTATAGSTTANFQMRSIVISGLDTTAKSDDGATAGCGGNWLIIKAYTTDDTLATNYAQGGSAANSLYLGWNYPAPKVNGGVATTDSVKYNAGISLAIVAGGATCTAKVLAGGGSADAAGATCAMSGSGTDMVATITLGKTDSVFGARYGVVAGAVQKITIETSGSDPGYSTNTVTS